MSYYYINDGYIKLSGFDSKSMPFYFLFTFFIKKMHRNF